MASPHVKRLSPVSRWALSFLHSISGGPYGFRRNSFRAKNIEEFGGKFQGRGDGQQRLAFGSIGILTCQSFRNFR